jgi:hypothetical protein
VKGRGRGEEQRVVDSQLDGLFAGIREGSKVPANPNPNPNPNPNSNSISGTIPTISTTPTAIPESSEKGQRGGGERSEKDERRGKVLTQEQIDLNMEAAAELLNPDPNLNPNLNLNPDGVIDPVRPPMSLFKSIFEDSESESESDNDREALDDNIG